MRLINTTTLEFEEFMSEEGLKYAILSHRWEDEEVSFKEMKKSERVKDKRGFQKIKAFCTLAARHGHKYAWVDTCCIDKRSSAELSEAINSMFRWYQNADMCYVYLADVNSDVLDKEFGASSWFKRGWTLQELLAPAHVHFYNCKWRLLGDKDDSTLATEISRATKIDPFLIGDNTVWRTCSVGERMSWASERLTTRPEDMAYSLLGIFDVNMPLLYGEGEKAFIRLQEEIIKRSPDRSIFTWGAPDVTRSGLLARSPAWFKWLNTTVRHSSLSPQYTMTNYGLSIEVILFPYDNHKYAVSLDHYYTVYCAFSLVRMTGSEPPLYQRIPLFSGFHNDSNRYPSLAANGKLLSRPNRRKTVFVHQVTPGNELSEKYPLPQAAAFFHLRKLSNDFDFCGMAGAGMWNEVEYTLSARSNQIGTTGIISLQPRFIPTDSYPQTILLGFDFDFVPVCIIEMSVATDVISPQNLPTSDQGCVIPLERDVPLSDDISRTSMEAITCFETKGWSEIYRGIAKEVLHRPRVWALKGFREDIGHLGVLLGETGWILKIMATFDNTATMIQLRQLSDTTLDSRYPLKDRNITEPYIESLNSFS